MFVDQIKQSDWSMVSSNEHMNHGCVRPELDRSKISKQAYSHCNRYTKNQKPQESTITLWNSTIANFGLNQLDGVVFEIIEEDAFSQSLLFDSLRPDLLCEIRPKFQHL